MFKKKILIIDDEPDFSEMIQMRLEANGYEIITAYNGDDGIKRARDEKPNLILLDVMMPGKDGFATLKELRRIPETHDINVVMLTAKGETKSIMSAQDIGASDYLIKPCESADLLEVCRRNA